MSKHIDFIDVAKGIGILLVVVGHYILGLSPNTDERIRIIIYSFHMPLFFIIAGYLFNFTKHKDRTLLFIENKFYRLIKPYFIYCVISYLYYGITNGSFPQKYIVGMLYGNGFSGWLDFNIPLWFLPCLFCAYVVFFLATKISFKRSVYIQIVVFLSIGVSGYLLSKTYRFLWGLDISLVAQVFMFIGYKLKNVFSYYVSSRKIFILIAILILLQASIVYLNGWVDMNARLYNNILLYYTGGVVGTFILLIVSTYLARFNFINCVLSYLGNNSLQIFALHSLAFVLLSSIAIYLPEYVIKYLFKPFYYVGGAIIISVLVSKLFENKNNLVKTGVVE